MESRPRGVSEGALLLLLACVQFTHIMDFMVMMPLGPQLMRELNISAAAFGNIISAFGITAGIAGLAMAPLPTASTAGTCCSSAMPASPWALWPAASRKHPGC